jgi:hypothetical protein
VTAVYGLVIFWEVYSLFSTLLQCQNMLFDYIYLQANNRLLFVLEFTLNLLNVNRHLLSPFHTTN